VEYGELSQVDRAQSNPLAFSSVGHKAHWPVDDLYRDVTSLRISCALRPVIFILHAVEIVASRKVDFLRL